MIKSSDNKKYYWLKLKDDFFRGKEIKKLRKIAGGDTYTIIYQKLLLLSLKDEGKLYFDGIEDDFAEELALTIDEDVENIKMTLAFMVKNRLIEQLTDSEYSLPKIPECIGRESDSAERVRKMRAKNKLLGEYRIDEKRYGGNGLKTLERDNFTCVNCGSKENICVHHKNGLSNELDDLEVLCRKCHSKVTCNVTCNTDVTKCNTEIEKEIDIEKDINTSCPKNKFSDDAIEIILSKRLFNLMLKNNPNAKEPNWQVWAKSIDLAIRVDKRTVEQLETVIDWCQKDSFWHTNILSTSKLREKFDRLVLDMNKKDKPNNAYQRKPSQRNNFEQRQYDDEYFDNFYSNTQKN